MWTKRSGNGDILTAQEWLNGRSLTTEEMNSMEVIDLLKEIHQSPNLLLMLQKIQGEEYTAQHFIEDYLVNLQSGLQSHVSIRSIRLFKRNIASCIRSRQNRLSW